MAGDPALREEEVQLLDHVRHTPVIFQSYADAVYDLRITVVGDQIFAAAIFSQETDYKIDCRIDIGNARIQAVTLPLEVDERLRTLMRCMGLVYGAVDMRLKPDGTYVFLEINPAGQFLYIEVATGLPITAAMAVALWNATECAVPGGKNTLPMRGWPVQATTDRSS